VGGANQGGGGEELNSWEKKTLKGDFFWGIFASFLLGEKEGGLLTGGDSD